MDRLNELAQQKLDILKQYYALVEKAPNVQHLGRIKIIRIRIRAGKVQRKKKFATQKGYTIRNNKIIRMTTVERLHRKRGSRIAKIKRHAEISRSLIKRKRSLRKRKSMGL